VIESASVEIPISPPRADGAGGGTPEERIMRTLLATFAMCAAAWAQNATTPGTVTTPYPTMENLAVEWAIAGDANLDGAVAVRYRVLGASAWSTGLPLRRVPAGSNAGFSWANKHSGTLFDLQPATTYEIELTLVDPDGGSTQTTVTAATRAVPADPASPNVRSAGPSTLASALTSAAPGDVILLDAGTYAGFTATVDGTVSQPIVIRSATPGAAVVNGQVRLDNRKYIHVEGLSIHGMTKFNGAEGVAIQRCTITADPTLGGIVAYTPDGTTAGATSCYIAYNDITGPYAWTDANLGANGATDAEGIQLTGPGNVICFNRLRGFRDCISFMEGAGSAVNQVCNDVHNNDLSVGCDDGIEADYAMGNCRIYRNRLTNCFVGISSQPSLGGPTYFIRNVMYNVVYAPFKLHNGSVGDVILHTTCVKCGDAFAVYAGATWSRAWVRNNLFIGGAGGGTYGGYGNGTGRVTDLADADATCSFNHDGYGSIGTGTFAGKIGGTSYTSLAGLRSLTTETAAVQADMSAFAAAVEFPATGPYPERATPDLRPAAGGAAIDLGETLANVNDGFAGGSPDLGAYELGDPLPQYGPDASGGGGEGGGGGHHRRGCGLLGIEVAALLLILVKRK
jgi:hypothetical protein